MNCKNCEKPLQQDDKFCSLCGAQVVAEKLTDAQVVREFSERYLSFDNKFLSTFKTLFTHPEWVVNGYLNGLRVRYVNPITYLIIAVTLSGLNVYLTKNGYFGDIDYAGMGGNQKTPIDMKEYMNSIYDFNSVIIFMAIPMLAFISKIVFYNFKQVNFAEHNLIYFYTYSQTSILNVLFLPLVLLLKIEYLHYALFTFVLMIGYHFFALQRIFNLTVKKMVYKTLLFIPIISLFYFIFSMVVAVIYVLYLISSGKINPQDFAQ